MPDRDTLPAPIRDFLDELDEIEGQEPLEKASLIHQFVNGYITFQKGDRDPKNEEFRFNKIMGVRQGDCDNYATLSAGLLQYAGFNSSDINLMIGLISFEIDYDRDGAIDIHTEANANVHAAIFLQIGEDFFSLDNTNAEVMKLDESLRYTKTNQDGVTLDHHWRNIAGFVNMKPGTHAYSCPDFLRKDPQGDPEIINKKPYAPPLEPTGP